MFILFTDYGQDGPYLGELELVLRGRCPQVPVVRLFNDLPRQDPRGSACLLAAYLSRLPKASITLAVVDPGVGLDEDRPVAVEWPDGWLLGPDNGLFDLACRHRPEAIVHAITWRPAVISASFWGRDLYAPVAAALASGDRSAIAAATLAGHGAGWPDDLARVIYCDHFGNAITGLRGAAVADTARIRVRGHLLTHAPTFAAVSPGSAFWYENSAGLVELAVNRGSARDTLGAGPGEPVAVLT